MTIEIYLGRGYTTTIDDCDADLLNCKWQPKVDRQGKKVYAVRFKAAKYNQEYGLLHRVVFERVLGRPLLQSEEIDHKNTNSLDCTRENLRLATRSQNMMNCRTSKPSKSGLKGAYQRGESWASQIVIESKVIHLGMHKTALDAHRAYCIAAMKRDPEFANFGVNSPFKPEDFKANGASHD